MPVNPHTDPSCTASLRVGPLAKARGAKIYGELVGYAANSDGYDMVAPSGIGGQNCMRLAMKMANEVGGEKQIDYVNTHGTSTPVGDLKELDAIKTVFTEAGYQPHVGSTKCAPPRPHPRP